MSTEIPRSPSDKYDHEALQRLQDMPAAEWQHLIPELLTWLQDRNWPIYPDVRSLLVRYAHAAIEPLKRILDGEDGDAEWQVNCIALIGESPDKARIALKNNLLALRERVSDRDDYDYDLKTEIDSALQGYC